MPIRLPFNSLLVPVRQIGPRVSASKLAGYSAAIVFLPLKPSAADWAAVPHGDVLRELYARKGAEGRRLLPDASGRARGTLLVAVCPAAQASTFERLQAAGKIARAVIESEPRSVLIWQQGCAAETVQPR